MDQRLAKARELAAEGRPGEAMALVEGILDDAPESAEVHYEQAVLAAALGLDAEEVEDSLVMALHYDPGHAQAALALADALERRGDVHRAADVLRAAFDRTTRADLAMALGRNLRAQGLTAESIEAFRTARTASHGDALAGAMLGLALFEAGNPVEAESALREALQIDRRCVEALHNLALVRFHAADFDEARNLVDSALALRPDSVPTLSLLGHLERDCGRIGEALRCYEECLRREPGFGDAMINRCYALLLDGQFERGWAEYARRFTLDIFPPRGLPFPEWRGEDPRDQGILVYAEQGIGDEVMFSSCLGDLMALGANVTLECSARLAPLFSRSFPQVAVHGMAKAAAPGWARSLKDIRWQVAIGDLPRFFRGRADRFPRALTGFLVPDARIVDAYRRRIEQVAAGRRVVALSWRGGDWRSGRARRSLPLAELSELVSGIPALWISLQHGEFDEEVRALSARDVDLLCWPEAVASPDEMAALLRAVDEVICVDNTVAHLSGAVGVAPRVLLSAAPEWRYGLQSDRMPWYPGMRLYRQRKLGDWGAVVDMVRRDISAEWPSVPGSDRT